MKLVFKQTDGFSEIRCRKFIIWISFICTLNEKTVNKVDVEIFKCTVKYQTLMLFIRKWSLVFEVLEGASYMDGLYNFWYKCIESIKHTPEVCYY